MDEVTEEKVEQEALGDIDIMKGQVFTEVVTFYNISGGPKRWRKLIEGQYVKSDENDEASHYSNIESGLSWTVYLFSARDATTGRNIWMIGKDEQFRHMERLYVYCPEEDGNPGPPVTGWRQTVDSQAIDMRVVVGQVMKLFANRQAAKTAEVGVPFEDRWGRAIKQINDDAPAEVRFDDIYTCQYMMKTCGTISQRSNEGWILSWAGAI